jgi:hypothetical protein
MEVKYDLDETDLAASARFQASRSADWQRCVDQCCEFCNSVASIWRTGRSNAVRLDELWEGVSPAKLIRIVVGWAVRLAPFPPCTADGYPERMDASCASSTIHCRDGLSYRKRVNHAVEGAYG